MKALTEDEDFSLPMTPMIDIVFQLLIFFLLATTITEEELDLNIKLAPGDQGAPRTAGAGTVINIGVRKDGTVTLSGQEIELGELENRLKEIGQAREKPKVIVRGDREAPHGKITQIYQLCVRNNLTEIFDPVIYDARPAP